ncbi:hypothetical protein CALVIDRAFT_170585 [Calocera viscosa TUFC12733]|uniref:Uncharacterized protein n=1 Tax=Calocera viscosa (strain TUFC12733) TaxID=1330018 RepID=A0A167L788_CALVF|nr:hypothetical protein CALVIDRAFT_170585 [Calocera viscosa TUFC12733]
MTSAAAAPIGSGNGIDAPQLANLQGGAVDEDGGGLYEWWETESGEVGAVQVRRERLSVAESEREVQTAWRAEFAVTVSASCNN